MLFRSTETRVAITGIDAGAEVAMVDPEKAALMAGRAAKKAAGK